MSVHDELTAVQRCLDDLLRSVGRLEQQLGSAAWRCAACAPTPTTCARASRCCARPPRARGTPRRPELVTIPDTPYDNTLWTDSDDEGLGARDRHAP